jgi:hypothetical protein
MSTQYTLNEAKQHSDGIMMPKEFTLDVCRSKLNYDRDSLLRALEMAVLDNKIDPDYCHTPDRTTDNYTLVANTPELKMQMLRQTKNNSTNPVEYELLFVFKKTLSTGEVSLKGALRHRYSTNIILCSSGSKSLYARDGWSFIDTYDANLGSCRAKITAPAEFWTYLYSTL